MSALRRVTERDRRILAFLADRPGSSAAAIAGGLRLVPRTLRHRLEALTADGYVVRRGPAGREGYAAGRALPDPSSRVHRRCPTCDGRWVPARSARSPECPACVATAEIVACARAREVPGVEVVVRPLASRVRAAHPLRPGEHGWLDGPGDVDAMVGDREDEAAWQREATSLRRAPVLPGEAAPLRPAVERRGRP